MALDQIVKELKIINDDKLIKSIEKARIGLKELMLQDPKIRKKDIEKKQAMILVQRKRKKILCNFIITEAINLKDNHINNLTECQGYFNLIESKNYAIIFNIFEI